jgi:ketosteroid isomerase-like protein
MAASVGRSVAKNARRWRWLLYVVGVAARHDCRTVVPMHLTEISKDGKTTEMDLRYTGIEEKRGASWLLVHDHLSAPVAGN